MKPYRYSDFISDLRKRCAKHGIELELGSGGRGSHQSLVFRDPERDRAVGVTIARHREISPGVQHGIISALARYDAHTAVSDLAQLVVEILKDLCKR